jgi:hypothetical protein
LTKILHNFLSANSEIEIRISFPSEIFMAFLIELLKNSFHCSGRNAASTAKVLVVIISQLLKISCTLFSTSNGALAGISDQSNLRKLVPIPPSTNLNKLSFIY